MPCTITVEIIIFSSHFRAFSIFFCYKSRPPLCSCKSVYPEKSFRSSCSRQRKTDGADIVEVFRKASSMRVPLSCSGLFIDMMVVYDKMVATDRYLPMMEYLAG